MFTLKLRVIAHEKSILSLGRCVADQCPRPFGAEAAAILANMAELVVREMELAAAAALAHARQVGYGMTSPPQISATMHVREGATGACPSPLGS